jgi:hypothetical protein
VQRESGKSWNLTISITLLPFRSTRKGRGCSMSPHAPITLGFIDGCKGTTGKCYAPSVVPWFLLLISQPHFLGILFRAFQGFARKPLVSLRNFLPSKYLGFRFPMPSKKTKIYAVVGWFELARHRVSLWSSQRCCRGS